MDRILDRKYGPFSGRVYGLILNLIANAVAIHGAINYVIKGHSPLEMFLGIGTTVICCLILAIPSK